MAPLNKGLQHSIEKPLDKYWTDLIMESECAIQMLDTKTQAPYWILSTAKLKQIRTSSCHKNPTMKQQTYISYSETTNLHTKDYKFQTCKGRCNNSKR
jgi:hypothetical protein